MPWPILAFCGLVLVLAGYALGEYQHRLTITKEFRTNVTGYLDSINVIRDFRSNLHIQAQQKDGASVEHQVKARAVLQRADKARSTADSATVTAHQLDSGLVERGEDTSVCTYWRSANTARALEASMLRVSLSQLDSALENSHQAMTFEKERAEGAERRITRADSLIRTFSIATAPKECSILRFLPCPPRKVVAIVGIAAGLYAGMNVANIKAIHLPIFHVKIAAPSSIPPAR